MSELPLPPTDRYQAGQYKETVKMLAKSDRATVQRGPVAVTVRIYRARRSGDILGRLKAVLEACAGVYYEHHSQIRELSATLLSDRHSPRVEVEVKPLQCADVGEILTSGGNPGEIRG